MEIYEGSKFSERTYFSGLVVVELIKDLEDIVRFKWKPLFAVLDFLSLTCIRPCDYRNIGWYQLRGLFKIFPSILGIANSDVYSKCVLHIGSVIESR